MMRRANDLLQSMARRIQMSLSEAARSALIDSLQQLNQPDLLVRIVDKKAGC
jgi:hypothetical protein